MPASRAQPTRGGGITTVHIMLIVFVALWLVFTVLSVVLYTGQEALVKAADDASKQADKYMKKSEAGRFQHFLDQAGTSSLAKVLDDERIALVQLIGEDATVGAAAATKHAAERIRGVAQGLPGGVLNELQQDNLLQVITDMGVALKAQAQRAGEAEKSLKQVGDTLKQKEAEVASEQKKVQETRESLEKKYKNLEGQQTTFEEDKKKQLAVLQQRISKLRDEAEEQLVKAQGELRSAREQADRLRVELKQTQDQLTQFRPKLASMDLAMRSDGRIVRATPGEDVVYIDLGQNDHLMRGLRFQVLSTAAHADANDPNGVGKATIEVADILPTTSQCRIIKSSVSDPIVSGDPIFNVIYDRTRKYKFAIEGLFDLNGDGRRDSQDTDKIRAWVENWGGEVITIPPFPAKLEKCQTCGQSLRPENLGLEKVDFLVLGECPPKPAKAGAGTKPEEREQIENDQKARDRYMTIEQQARELGLAILTQSQFLNFIGQDTKIKKAAPPPDVTNQVMAK